MKLETEPLPQAAICTASPPGMRPLHSYVLRRCLFTLALTALALFAIVLGERHAHGDPGPIPENAREKGYGTGWECKPGYLLKDGACAAVVVPENAYAASTSFSPGWMCARGFLSDGNACKGIEIPDNAYLSPTGSGWNCARGYRKHDQGCAKIDVPQNGYLDNSPYGSGWKCDRGYRPVGELCAPIRVPENAFLSEDTLSGPSWQCERGYRAVGETCAPLTLPENTHLDYSGNNWDCDPPYMKQRDKCVLFQ